MPWKNGSGFTSQIHLVPETARFPKEEFLWRVSSAPVSQPNQFSFFPGYDRWLVVWQGAGFIANGQEHKAFAPWHFRGEEEIHCQPQGKDVVDLGVIFRRGQVDATMTSHELFSGKPEDIPLQEGFHYFFCAQGAMTCNGILVESPGTLRATGAGQLQISAFTAITRFVHIFLRKKSSSGIS